MEFLRKIFGIDRPSKTGPTDEGKGPRLSSKDLAVLVVDALSRARVLKEWDVPRSIEIAAEEIEVRKALGDY